MKKLLIISLMILLIIPFAISVNIECNNAVNYIRTMNGNIIDFTEGIGDLDNDGDNDIAVTDFSSTDVFFFENNGLGGFTFNSLMKTFGTPQQTIIVDIDGDNDNDIVARDGSADKVYILKNDGSGNFVNTSFSVIQDTTGMVAVDLNQDGEIDIAVLSVTTDSLVIYTNDGSETFTSAYTKTITDANFMRAIDVDGDNDYDLLIANYLTGWVRWYENNGLIVFDEHNLSDNIKAYDIAGADFDGDGDIDIVSANYNDGAEEQLQWYENDGNEVFTKHNISYVDKVRTIAVNDLDNDGDIDIITGDITDDKITIWENNGDGIFTGNNITDNFEPFSISVGDINEDDIPDIVFFDDQTNRIGFIDGANCQGYPTRSQFIVCEFPSLFCDDFNYGNPMSENNWLVQLGAGQINNTFTPINDKLQLKNEQFIIPYHETEAFETSYRPDSSSRFTRHIYSPIFSSQFYLNVTNQTDGGFKYAAYQTQNIPAYILKAEVGTVGNSSGNMNWFYINQTQPSIIWKELCSNCTTTGDIIFIKINSLFAHREVFPFNSSISDDEILVYANNILIGTIEDYIDGRTVYLSQYEIIKENDYNFTVDDYYVMVGTDTEIPTFEQYYEDYFIDTDVINETVEVGVGTGDMATALASIWDDMGLLSVASRIMTGLFLMFLLALIMFGMALKMGTNLSAAVLIIVELFFMILLVYIKLLPIWLPFVIVLVAAGVGAAVIKLGTQT